MIGHIDSGFAPRIKVLGIPVDDLSMTDTVTRIESFIESRRSHMVITADSSGIVEAHRDPEFFEIFQSADLVTADSEGVLWAAKRMGTPLRERVSGVDIFANLCRLSAEKGYKVFLIGASPGVAEIAAERCRLLYPGCNIVGSRHGFFPPESDEVVAQEIAVTKPDILFVAMGMPRQEKFIQRTRDIICAPVAIGVGGTLDVFSGRIKRAPRFIQSLKMEWLYRLFQNPKKFAKVKNLPIFVRMILRSRA
jgi:N-acetylglucosaminyldiphosphoundecaprenol N-acetyl-beta-D-mannosaminyltransferase